MTHHRILRPSSTSSSSSLPSMHAPIALQPTESRASASASPALPSSVPAAAVSPHSINNRAALPVSSSSVPVLVAAGTAAPSAAIASLPDTSAAQQQQQQQQSAHPANQHSSSSPGLAMQPQPQPQPVAAGGVRAAGWAALPLSSMLRLSLPWTSSLTFQAFVLLSLAHLTVLFLNQQQLSLHLLFVSLPISLSSLLMLTALYSSLLTALFLTSHTRYLLSRLQAAESASAALRLELTSLSSQYARLKAACGGILVPFPLDLLVEQGIERGIAEHQQRKGVMQAAVIK